MKFSLETLLQHKKRVVKNFQGTLATLEKKRKWYRERVISIEMESLKLERACVEARERGDLKKECALEEFLHALEEARSSLIIKGKELSTESAEIQEKLTCALKERKMIEKLKENRYNRLQLKQRKFH